MRVQWQMHGVERQIALHQNAEALKEAAGDGHLAAPEQPVMDEQQLGSLIGGAAQDLQPAVDRERHA